MRFPHNPPCMNLDPIRTLFMVVEQGSLNKAAERLRLSQSTLTRQIQALEADLGGLLLERTPGGVSPTALGHALLEGMRPVLTNFDEVVEDMRKRARGQSGSLRIGYLASAAPGYLLNSLSVLRQAHPEVKVRLLDLSPGEQITALRKGEIDVALLGSAGSFLAREFHVRRVASMPVIVALAEQNPLAKQVTLRLADLKTELFVGALEADMPGHNQWVTQLCRRSGFRPRFVLDSESLAHGLSTIVTEGAVSLMPEYIGKTQVPGVVFRPLRGSSATWDLMVAWQRGKVPTPLRSLLDSLLAKPA